LRRVRHGSGSDVYGKKGRDLCGGRDQTLGERARDLRQGKMTSELGGKKRREKS